MKKLLIFSVTVFFGLGLISCTERINIELDESSVRLVVEGSVTTDTMVHKVILSKSTSYYYDQVAPAVTGASVTISYGVNVIQLNEVTPGIYETDSTFFGIEGETYKLDIVLANALGGYTEYSASSHMSQVVNIDSLKLLFHSDWNESGMWEVKCFFQDPPTSDYYRYLVSRNGRLITDTLDEWFITDDRFFRGAYVDGTTVAVLEQGSGNEGLEEGDEIAIELDCIARDYAMFLSEAQMELMGSNPLFSGPPANVSGNISNGAIGIFTAYSTSRAKVKAYYK